MLSRQRRLRKSFVQEEDSQDTEDPDAGLIKGLWEV